MGWRGPLPRWPGLSEATAGLEFSTAGFKIQFVTLRDGVMGANLKPEFMQQVLERHSPEASGVVYFDPDIVVDAPWSFFESWVAEGVAICEDNCFPKIPANHYLRRHWTRYIASVLKLGVNPTLDQGFNSGFLGVSRSQCRFLQTWRSLIEGLPSVGISLSAFKPGTRFDPYFGTDQDTLDMAAMVHTEDICSLGPEGMGFVNGMTAMWHAVDGPKPWRRFYLHYLLRTGQRISEAHRGYWRHASGPIRTRSRWALFLRRFDLKLAIALSRFYSSP